MAYTGGKGRTYQCIISLMPPHRTYIETHLGGGAIMRRKRQAKRSIGIDIDARVIERWQARAPEGVELVHGCAVQFLRRHDFVGDELVYADPPYWPSARRRARCYRHDYSETDHYELLAVLRDLPCSVMVSGYPNAAYAALLADWDAHEILNQTQTGPVTEVVWMNFHPDHRLHDYSYVGKDFRARERLKRLRRNQVARLRRVPPLERAAMLSDILEEFPVELAEIAGRPG